MNLSCRERSPHLLSPPTGSNARFKFLVPGRFKDGIWEQVGKPEVLSELSVLERRCFGVFGIRGTASIPGSVTLVKDGVDLTTLAPPMLPKGVTTVLTAEGLPLDLSHFFKPQVVKGVVHYGPDCFGHNAFAPMFMSKPESTIFGLSFQSNVDHTNHFLQVFL